MKSIIGATIGAVAMVQLALFQVVQAPASATPAASGSAILPGFNTSSLAANDDGSTDAVALPFSLNFFGATYSSLYVNNNGNVTFGSPLSAYTPQPLSQISLPMIAPFWADVDTRVGNVVTYGAGTVNGKAAFGVNWIGVGCFNANNSVQNTFQLILIDESKSGPGNFDIEFNYGTIQWDSGQASGGDSQCLGGTAAAAGYTNGVTSFSATSRNYTYELPGSGVDNAFLSTNLTTGLSNQSIDSGLPGRDLFSVRSGTPQKEASVHWAGLYAKNGGPYTGSDAEFVVPTLSCTKSDSSVSIWTGVGGELPSDGQTLIQNGVLGACSNGQAAYQAFWQSDPQITATGLNTTNYPVKPGDNIAVSVADPTPSQVQFFFDNYTENWSTEVTAPIRTGTPVGTAECIVEAPFQAAPKGTKVKIAPLANFGTVYFSSCSADNQAGITCYLPGTANCAYGSLAVTLDMQDKRKVLATTVWPTDDGSAFEVRWQRAS
jgi:hypothetical protein